MKNKNYFEKKSLEGCFERGGGKLCAFWAVPQSFDCLDLTLSGNLEDMQGRVRILKPDHNPQSFEDCPKNAQISNGYDS
jgi:hypothetical protein